MKCPQCERPMTPLFYSCVCDFCDGLVDEDSFEEGFVVLRKGRALPSEEYVFQSRRHAETWREETGLGEAPIVSVRAPVRFRWRRSTGSIRGLVIADQLVTIYPDHRFPPRPNCAYVAEPIHAEVPALV